MKHDESGGGGRDGSLDFTCARFYLCIDEDRVTVPEAIPNGLFGRFVLKDTAMQIGD